MGKLQILPPREFTLMVFIWTADHPLSMEEIRMEMGDGEIPANVSTTAAQVQSLIRKDFLGKNGHRGQKATYYAAVSKEDYYKHELREFQKRWNFNGIMRVI